MTTLLGDIEICIDGKTIKYTAQNMGVMDRLCLDVDGRFCIKVEFVPDGERHTISCIIKSHIPSDKDGVESGEQLALKSFYKGHSKLSDSVFIPMKCREGIEKLVRIFLKRLKKNYRKKQEQSNLR